MGIVSRQYNVTSASGMALVVTMLIFTGFLAVLVLRSYGKLNETVAVVGRVE